MKKETTYPSLIPLHVWLVGQETKEACFEDGKRRLVGLGWEDRRLGDDQMGWGNEWLGEGLPNKLVQRYTRRHRDVLDKSTVAGVDKEKVSEAKLREYICGMESGPKTVEVCDNDGKIDRKSTRLNSSHALICYAVFCFNKKISLCLPPVRSVNSCCCYFSFT